MTGKLLSVVLAIYFLPFGIIVNTSSLLISLWNSSVVYVPINYRSIQQAIDAAAVGDTIIVLPGIYQEDITINKPLNIFGINATIVGQQGDAVRILSKNVTFSGFKIIGASSQGCGIFVWSSNTRIKNNSVSGFTFGIKLYDSKNIELKNNNMRKNTFNFQIWGLTIEHFFHSIDCSNKVDGKPIRYIVNETEVSVSGIMGYLAIVNSTNIKVENISLSSNGEGVLLAYSKKCEICNVKISNCSRGLRLIASNGNLLLNNFISNCEWAGVVLDSSSNNTVKKNILVKNTAGIFVSSSSLLDLTSKNNLIENNTIRDNNYGIILADVYGNQIAKNAIEYNHLAGAYLIQTEENTFYGNVYINNDIGLKIVSSSRNMFLYNSFLNESLHVEVKDPLVSINYWNSSYPKGGNYWDNVDLVDNFSGPQQDISGGDGIIDNPFIIADHNVDNLPLIAPPLFLELSIAKAKYPVIFVGTPKVKAISFSLYNKSLLLNVCGDSENGFRVQIPKKLLWCNRLQDWNILITGNCSLQSIFEGSDATYFYFVYACGACNLTFEATHSLVELGDVNFDGYLNMQDLLSIIFSFGSIPGHSRWNYFADVNQDMKIDIRDLILELRIIFSV